MTGSTAFSTHSSRSDPRKLDFGDYEEVTFRCRSGGKVGKIRNKKTCLVRTTRGKETAVVLPVGLERRQELMGLLKMRLTYKAPKMALTAAQTGCAPADGEQCEMTPKSVWKNPTRL